MKSQQKNTQLSKRENYVPEIWNMPSDNKLFTGREEILKDIEAALEVKDGYNKVQALSGLGGIGKTQTVKEYAYRHKGHYQLIWWINAKDSLDQDFSELAGKLGVPIQNKKTEDICEIVKKKLRVIPDWLLIFDDAVHYSQIQKYIPEQHTEGRGHILITSRNRLIWPNVSPLSPFTIKEAIEYIEKVTKQKKGAEVLAECLGCLPLALTQASAYINACVITINEYVSLFKEERQALWEQEQQDRDDGDDHYSYNAYMKIIEGKKTRLTVKTTLALSLDAIKESSSGALAMNILEYSAYLYHERIPEFLIKENTNFSEFNSAMQELNKHFILKVNVQEKGENRKEEYITYSLHQLTQQIVRDMSEEKKNEIIRTLLTNIEKLFPEVKDTPTKEWEEATLLKNHIETILSFASDIHIKEKGNILEKLGYYEQYVTSNFDKSLAYALQEMKLYKIINQGNHPDIAKSLNHVGYAYISLGKAKEGLDHLKQALDMFKIIHGTKAHLDVAMSLNMVGQAHKESGMLKESLDYFKQAFDMFKELYEEKPHTDMVIIYNNLGNCYKGLGKMEDALYHLERALAMCQILELGNHSDVANILNNMGSVFEALKDPKKSVYFYKEALEMFQNLYPKTHPFVAMGLNNTGFAYMRLEKVEEALPYLEQALEAYKALYPKGHPLVVNSLSNLGSAYRKTKDVAQALKYTEQAHAMCVSMYGDAHAITLIIGKNREDIKKQLFTTDVISKDTNNKESQKNSDSGFRILLGEHYILNEFDRMKQVAEPLLDLVKCNRKIRHYVAQDIQCSYQKYIAEKRISDRLPESIQNLFRTIKQNQLESGQDPQELLDNATNDLVVITDYLEYFAKDDEKWPYVQGILSAFAEMHHIEMHFCTTKITKEGEEVSTAIFTNRENHDPLQDHYISVVHMRLDAAQCCFTRASEDISTKTSSELLSTSSSFVHRLNQQRIDGLSSLGESKHR